MQVRLDSAIRNSFCFQRSQGCGIGSTQVIVDWHDYFKNVADIGAENQYEDGVVQTEQTWIHELLQKVEHVPDTGDGRYSEYNG